jgi:hypothetical protein
VRHSAENGGERDRTPPQLKLLRGNPGKRPMREPLKSSSRRSTADATLLPREARGRGVAASRAGALAPRAAYHARYCSPGGLLHRLWPMAARCWVVAIGGRSADARISGMLMAVFNYNGHPWQRRRLKARSCQLQLQRHAERHFRSGCMDLSAAHTFAASREPTDAPVVTEPLSTTAMCLIMSKTLHE